MGQKFDVRSAFIGKQSALEASYSTIRAATGHPGTKGDEAEADWVGMLRDFLPRRYEVGPIFAVDADGSSSDQIDLAVYDQQYSPQWFGTKSGARFVPVESVYAVFEVKPKLNLDYLAYAADKVASVRTLRRTSALIKHAGGTYSAIDPSTKHLIGGILTTQSGWTEDTIQARVAEYLLPLGEPGALDIGIALDTATFDRTPDPKDGDSSDVETQAQLTFSREGEQLIHFAIRLFSQLQLLGTALAMDMGEYETALRPDS